MKTQHVLLAILVAVIWGAAFIASKIGLDSFSPSQLTALRFLLASVLTLFVPRPSIAWPLFVLIALTLYTGQFLFQFFAIANGMPPGLASVVVQTQALFTILFAAIALRDLPTTQQLAGILVAFIGLGMIGMTLGRGLTTAGLILAIASAMSWGIGNVLMKRLAKVEMLHLVAWLSLIAPLPALALSFILDEPFSLPSAIVNASWLSLGAVLYLGFVATVVAYAIWGTLLRLYPTAMVTPFALLTPCVGALLSAIIFGEQFEPLRLAGVASMVLGLIIVIFPVERVVRKTIQLH